jgi:FlaA1/EpsC-like NDP-sugar epimerase
VKQAFRQTYIALIPHRRVANVLGDSAFWTIALVGAALLRFEFRIPSTYVTGTFKMLPVAIFSQFLVGLTDGLYVGRWSLGSFEEVAALCRTATITAGLLVLVYLPSHWVPLSVAITAPVLALSAMAGSRYVWRLQMERSLRPQQASQSLLVYGAGEAGAQVVTSLLRDRNSPWIPVALIDDDDRKRNLRIRGVPVLGTGRELGAVVEQTGATAVLVAIPSADAAFIREVSNFCLRSDLDFRVVPPPSELFNGTVGAADIRPVTEVDLLGRREIRTDLASIAGYLTGRRVLVTGAGGSIGSELCRQVHALGPSRLLMLDRDESALHAVQLSIEGRALLDSDDLVLCDLRDAERTREVFERHRPEVVFHAAALKHLTLLERHPAEGLKTNVFGTQLLLDLALELGVQRFVNISTDKAADPTSVLGSTKRIAERLTAHASERTDGTYLSVRFGNVLGSRGSVLPLFRKQIEAGGPVTVTDPNVTRFFMTIEEAVQLVVQAGAIGGDGEVLVFDMGEPVKIAQVAQQLIAQSGREIEIEYTGLRPGEKMHEVLLAPEEHVARSIHPLISHVVVPPLSPHDLDDLAGAVRGPSSDLIRHLMNVAQAPDPASGTTEAAPYAST